MIVNRPNMDAFTSFTRIFLSLFAIIICTFTSFSEAEFKCPQKNGVYEDSIQCDKYYQCEDGIMTEKLCPDGLVFDPLNRKVNKCDQPFNVDCGNRLELQEPKSNHLCPRRNGYFAHPNEKICNIFYNCIEGDGTEIVCPTGLHFDEYSGTCVWPDSAGRSGCETGESIKLKDGFSCPQKDNANGGDSQKSHQGPPTPHPVYAHPSDCQKFYVCLNGVTPREQGCSVGEVYNEELKKCDDPENVPGCENWYKDDPKSQKQKKN